MVESATVSYQVTISLTVIIAVTALNLTCDKILEMPIEKKLTLQELQSTPPKEMVDCLAQLGREQLGAEEAALIWKSIVEFYGGISNIPDFVLMLLHWVTAAISPEDFTNLTLSSIDVIQNFGLNYNLNEAQLSAIADRVRVDFAGKLPEDYTYYDLVALRQILCAFNRSEIEMIHPAAYREAALLISKLERCSPTVLAGFATLAVQEDAFGSPGAWSDTTWEIVGHIGEYVSKDASQGRPTVPTTKMQENKTL